MAQNVHMRKMLIVTDGSGRIVAAAHPGEASSKGVNVGITALPGQTIHEIDVPEAISQLSGRDFHHVVSQARMEPGTAKITFPEIRIQRAKREA